jgi:CRISPR-associated endonuclease Csn1
MSTVWSFDLGKGSIGEAVRDIKTNQFLHVESLLIPAEFASTKEATKRRRFMRTRLAHKMREQWLDEVWRKAGQEPLIGRRVGKVDGKWKLISEGDKRLEREFPEKGDSTCYTSCLLRIKLLRGDKLEPWQIYKALHSAIQKRGYGRVPWAARELGKRELTEEEIAKELKKADDDLAKKDPIYKAAVEAWPKFKEEVPDKQFHYPCYYDAAKMKVWDYTKSKDLAERITFDARSTRRVRFDRDDVNGEIAELARQAAKQLPALAEAFTSWRKSKWEGYTLSAQDIGEFVVYGPAGKPTEKAEKDFGEYLKFRVQRGIHPGTNDDWMAATGQKTPRFDNRIINDCALLDGMQVCNVEIRYDEKKQFIYPDSLLPSEVTFLMKLKNTRVADGGNQRKLRVDEIKKIFALVSKEANGVKRTLKSWAESVAKKYSINEKDWGSKKGIKELGLRPLAGHEVVKPPKTEGRSRFSRPALRLAKALILSGDKPSVFLKRLLDREQTLLDEIGLDVLDAPPPTKAKDEKSVKRRPWVLTKQLKFLHDLAQPKTDIWEGIYFPEQRLDSLEARHRKDGVLDREAAIREIIADNNDPIVRHRLTVFAERLSALEQTHGAPEQIVLEFVREDFMGKKAKMDLAKFQSDREKARKEAREQAAEAGAGEKSAPLKYELAKAQGFRCLYCKDESSFAMSKLDEYEIDHIVPRSKGGPDAMVNYVLAHKKCNEAKGERTPFDWKHGTEGWDAYTKMVGDCSTTLRNKKIQLLLREDAPELVDRYTALAETAWISKLAQKIASIHFGWRNSNDEQGDKRVTIVSGGLTGRIRRRYKLNSVLNPNAETEEEAEKKNRKDDRHHALDAMVINFLPLWMRDPKKDRFFRFPDPVAQNPHGFFSREIDRVMPKVIAYEKSVLADTTYAGRWRDSEKKARVIVQRTSLVGLAMKPAAQGKANFDLEYLEKQIDAIREPKVKLDGRMEHGALVKMLKAFCRTSPTKEEWERYCSSCHLPMKDGSTGPRVKSVTVLAGSPTEYSEMSKDGTGSWRKGFGSHKGQIIYLAACGSPAIQPVYVHSSVVAELAKLKEQGAKLLGFFQSRCLVRTSKPIPPEDYNVVIKNDAGQKRRITAEAALPPSDLTLRNIVTKDISAEMSLADNTRVVAKIDVWVKAGLMRV